MLAFLVGIFFAIVFIALLIGSKAFRWAVLVFLAIAIIGIAMLVQWSNESSRRYAAEEAQKQARIEKEKLEQERQIEERSKLVKLQDLQIGNVGLSGINYSYFKNVYLTGSLLNNSPVDLASLEIRVRLYDCSGAPKKDYSNCDIIGEDEERVEANVPTKQKRQIRGTFNFPNTPRPSGALRWSYELRSIRAQ
jgi:hypothetical protein